MTIEIRYPMQAFRLYFVLNITLLTKEKQFDCIFCFVYVMELYDS
jgi:hypothetical protein